MNINSVRQYLQEIGEPNYRFRQILENYYSGRYESYSNMTNLSLSLRAVLNQKFPLYSVEQKEVLSSTNSKKVRLLLGDGLSIESVLMKYSEWSTVCLSTQVGCPLGCSFCATGKMGFKRNLTSEEIVDQILFWKKTSPVNRIVFMGMGEPFLNYDNLLLALDSIKNNLNIGSRKISISTAGIPSRIQDFANLDTEVNLALSLHSAIDTTRSFLMPVNRQYPLAETMKAIEFYTNKTHRQVFFEYALIDGVNDSSEEISAVIKLISQSRLYFLNVITLNPTGGSLKPSPRLPQFTQALDRHHLNYSVRESLGQSINSACGQLIVENRV